MRHIDGYIYSVCFLHQVNVAQRSCSLPSVHVFSNQYYSCPSILDSVTLSPSTYTELSNLPCILESRYTLMATTHETSARYKSQRQSNPHATRD